jgi:hypothetical protein
MKNTAFEYNFELVLIFDGTFALNHNNCLNWTNQQRQRVLRVNKLFRFGNRTWIEPDFLRQTIQYVTRFIEESSRNNRHSQNLFVFNTIDDHRKDIIDFCCQKEFDGIFTDDLELITLYLLKGTEKNSVLRKPIFSANSFRLLVQHKGLEAKRYNFDAILQSFNLNYEQFGWLLVLLGSYWFPFEWLYSFYTNVLPSNSEYEINEIIVMIYFLKNITN